MSRQPIRPLSVTWLAVFVLIITGWQWFRFVKILQRWKLLNELPLNVPTIYLALSSLVWGLLATVLAWALISGLRWAPLALRWLSASYVLIFWVDRIFLRVGENISNQALILLITLIALAVVYWILSRSATRAYFIGEHHE